MKSIFFLLIISAVFVTSQDFGYERAMLSEYRSIGVGYHAQKFSGSSSNSLPDSNRIQFSTGLPVIELRQNNGRLAVGYQTYTDIKGSQREAFSVFGENHNDIALTGGKGDMGSILIPIVVSAAYLRAESPVQAIGNFDVGSLGLGSGIKYRYFDRSFGIQAFAIGSLSYASEGFSTDYGSQTSLAAEIQLIFSGLVTGYRFESQRWNMSSNILDYQRWYHGAFIGVVF